MTGDRVGRKPNTIVTILLDATVSMQGRCIMKRLHLEGIFVGR
jgi:hypothetical protein